jgi:5-formyltetrahydrofolate cyclo-ligase
VVEGCGVSEFSHDFNTIQGVTKAQLRSQLLTLRRSRPSPADDDAVRATLVDLAAGVPIVAGYAPLPGEPGGPELPDALAGACGLLLLPVLRPDRDLDWAPYRDRLVPGARGLREPPGKPAGPEAIGGAGLVIVPAVAADRRGVRLGRGGGSYDRALARTGPGCLVVAVLYDREVLPEVPEQPHDRRVTAIVTPSGGLHRTAP